MSAHLWDGSKDPVKLCVVCGVQMFRYRDAAGTIRPLKPDFIKRKYCSYTCRSVVYTNTEVIPFERISEEGQERWIVDPESGCWVWQLKSIMGGGYGSVWNGLRTIGAHRWAYESLVGEVPDGLELDHLCRNRICINPDHLEPVTHIVNKRRGVATILNEDKVQEIRKLHKEGTKYKVLAEKFGVHVQTINYILMRKLWKDVA